MAQPTSGLMVDDGTAKDGYVLFSNNTTTYLIDRCGLMVNSWSSDYKPGGSAYLLENGNLLRTAEVEGFYNAGGAGGRFELYNWNGSLIWSYQIASENLHAHHDIEPLPNGNFLAIVSEKHAEGNAQANGRMYNGNLWSERVVEIKMSGTNQAEIVWEWQLWDHLIQDKNPTLSNYGQVSDHPELVDINFIGEDAETSGNWVHMNAIDYNLDLDQIAVSSRLFSEVWIIDHSISKEEAAGHTAGEHGKGGDLLYRFGNPQAYQQGVSADQILKHQHDVRWVPTGYLNAGHLMVFNNEYSEQQSSVEIWNAPTDAAGIYQLTGGKFGPAATDWTYSAPEFFSNYMSGAHALEDRHIFICEGLNGRFFEINQEKEVVWEYINPVNANGGPAIQGGTVRFNQTFRATKYPSDYAAFSDKNMNGTVPVELNPWESTCFQPDSTAHSEEPTFVIAGNLMREQLNIKLNTELPTHLSMYDITGNLIFQSTINYGSNTIPVDHLTAGVYLIVAAFGNASTQTEKVFKF